MARQDAVQDIFETIALDDLSDVVIGTPSGGQGLIFDTGSGKWINRNQSTSSVVAGEGIDVGVTALGFATQYEVSAELATDANAGILSFNQNITWTGTHQFEDDVTFTDGTATIVYDKSEHQWIHTIKSGGTNHFQIIGTESASPGASPKYFDLDITRSWSGAGLTGDVMSAVVDDDRTISSGTETARMFNFEHDIGGMTIESSTNIISFRLAITGTPTVSGTNPSFFGIAFGNFFNNTQLVTPAYNEAAARTSTLRGIDMMAGVVSTNTGAGTATDDNYFLTFGTAFGVMVPGVAGDDALNIWGFNYIPSATSFTGNTITAYGYYYNPTFTNAGGTINSYIIWATKDDIVLDSDSSKIIQGDGQDVEMYYDGTDWIFDVVQATTTVKFNPTATSTAFEFNTDSFSIIDTGGTTVTKVTNEGMENKNQYACLAASGTTVAYSANGVWLGIEWDKQVRLDSIYSHTAGASGLGFASAGSYLVTADLSTDVTQGTLRYQSQMRLLQNATEIDSTRASTYNRNTVDGKDTMSVKIINNFASGDNLHVQVSKDGTAVGSLITIAQGCRLNVEKI
jgi:hypothetical protein